MEIEFKIATRNGIQTCRGELIERNGFQYALHTYEDEYKATELSTGMCVVSVGQHTYLVNGDKARNYLLSQIEAREITKTVLLRAFRK